MADTPTDAVPQILIRIQDSIGTRQSEIGQFRTSVEGRLDRVEGQLDLLEQTARKHRRDAAATLVMMRATISHFDQRLGNLEERVTVLETPKR